MTEADWLLCDYPQLMLTFLERKASTRKLQLFVCATARHLIANSLDENQRVGIDALERSANSQTEIASGPGIIDVTSPLVATYYDRPQPKAPPFVSIGSLVQPRAIIALLEAMKTFNEIHAGAWGLVAQLPVHLEDFVEYGQLLARLLPIEEYQSGRYHDGHVVAILRDLFGNPFRPVAFDPAWRTSDVLLLARGIYEGRAFDRMPILADALQDAGCDNPDILDHCRDAAQPHVRGCWVVDLVLGKE